MFFFESSDRPAVSDGESSLTYRELDLRAEFLANGLTAMGVSADTVVGLCMPRNVDTVVAMLGVLRAGGAYLPLETDLPTGRLKYIVGEARPSFVLVQDESYAAKIAGLAPVVSYNQAVSAGQVGPGSVPRTSDPSGSLAYVLYTSGSTGRPKGVGMTRAGAMNVMMWEAVERVRSDRGAQLSRLGFDISFQEIMATLLGRGHVVILPDECRTDHRELLDTLAARQVERIHLTPTALTELAREFARRSVGLSLRSIVVSGEKLRLTEQIRQFVGALPSATLENAYGMTELHNVSSVVLTGDPADWPAEPSIGRPIWNTEIFVLDDDGELCATGGNGHLCVGGHPVSRGYHLSPGLTAERYLPSKHTAAAGGRLFRTGDIGHRLEDGSFRIVGRAGRQVKHHGYRIDLAEVELALLRDTDIVAAAVRQVAGSAVELVAYCVTRDGRNLDSGAVRAGLRSVLPEYMMPNRLVGLPALPVTSTGKVDYDELPDPPRPSGAGSPVPPTDEAQAKLANLWAAHLGVAEVGIRDDFFELGGDSLLASRIAAEFREFFEPGVPVRAFFEGRTVERILAGTSGERRPRPPGAALRPGPAGTPVVSSARRRFWYQRHELGSATWLNNVLAYRIEGTIDVTAVGEALTAVARRHSALQETVVEIDGVVAIERTADVRIIVSLVDLPPEASARAVRDRLWSWCDEDTVSPLRCALFTIGPQHHVLALALNHMSSDARSEHILVREFSELYSGLVAGEDVVLPAPAVGYGDFALWEREWLGSAEAARQLDYWRAKLAGLPELELPVDRVRPAGRRADGAYVPVAFDEGLTAELERVCRAHRVSLFMVLAAVFGVVLSRYAGQDDVAVGTAVAGRRRREFDGIVGLFINTVVLRSRVRGEATFADYLAEVRDTALGAFENQDVPFDRVVEHVRPDRDVSRNPLFQVMFVFDGTGAPRLRLHGARVEGFVVPPRSSQVDLTLELGVTGPGELGGQVVFATDLFEVSTVRRLVEHYGRVLRAVVGRPEIRLADIELLTPAERASAIERATGGVRPAPALLVHEAFARNAAADPDKGAVVDGEVRRSYGELDRAANRLAHRLRELGVGLEKPVGVFLPRGERLVTAMLAVLKAGGVYLPLDPALPDDRVRYIVGDAGAGLVVTTSDLVPRSTGTPTLCLDTTPVTDHPTTAPRVPVHPGNLAYIIYTSGSTGLPKGAAIPHSAVLNLLEWSVSRHEIRPDDRIVSRSPIAFDASIWELLAPMYAGATLLVAPDGPPGREHLLDFCAAHEATVLQVVPSLLSLLVSGPQPTRAPSLRLLLSGGEPLSNELCRAAHDRFSVAIDNVYGPAECAVDATAWRWDGEAAGPSPIGDAIGNVTAIPLTGGMEIHPSGARGVLHLGGRCLARGYVANARLTAERFVPDPFGPAGARLYVTGDVVSGDERSKLVFRGRSDRQVKLLGRRVEPAEIEAVAVRSPVVDRAAVVVDGPETARRLVCFVVPKTGATVEPDSLKEDMRKLLPAYMVPNVVVEIAEMPLTPSGKTDYARVHELLGTRQVAPAEDGELRTQWEKRVAGLLSEVLDVTSVAAADTFLELGGQSINGMRFVRRMAAEFGAQLSMRHLFDDLTVRELAVVAEKSTRKAGGQGEDE